MHTGSVRGAHTARALFRRENNRHKRLCDQNTQHKYRPNFAMYTGKMEEKKTTRNGRERRLNRRKEAEGEEEAVQNLHTPKSSFASYLVGSNKLLPARRHKTAELRTTTTITRRRRRRRRATATATATEYYSFTIKTHCALCHCVTD